MKIETEIEVMGLMSLTIIFFLLSANHLFAGNTTEDISRESVNALEQGQSYHDQGNYSKAIEEYDRTIQLRPSFADAYNNRGAAYVKLGNLENGLKDFYAAIALDRSCAGAYYNRGVVYFRLGSFSHAKTDLDMAIKLNPKYADAYYNLTVVYGNLGRIHKETEDFVKVIELSQQNQAVKPRNDLRKEDEKTIELDKFKRWSDELAGGNERQHGELNAVMKIKNRVEELTKENERLRKELAAIVVVTRHDPSADLNKTIIGPTAIDWFKKGYSSAMSGNHQEAIDSCDKAIERNPNFPEAYYVRGIAYNNLGDPNLALQNLDKAIELNKEFAGAYYHRGLAYNDLGDPDQEMENYKMAARLGFKTAQDYLKDQMIAW
jgi:tetratricopeptide (TPR) repeat protein